MPRTHSGRSSRSARRWRRRSRGVSDIVATLLLVAITVVLAAILYLLVTHYYSAVSTTPGLSTSLALATPQNAVGTSALVGACAATPCNFYNMSVQDASKGLELHDLAFEVVATNDSVIVPTGGIVVVSGANAVVANYGFKTSWTTGGTTAVTDLLTIVLYTSGATPQSLSGDTFRVVGVSGYSGSIDIHIY
jgi:flagellin-like protein